MELSSLSSLSNIIVTRVEVNKQVISESRKTKVNWSCSQVQQCARVIRDLINTILPKR